MKIFHMEMIRKFAKLSFFSHLEAYFSEKKDLGFEPPINKEGFKKFQSIFFSLPMGVFRIFSGTGLFFQMETLPHTHRTFCSTTSPRWSKKGQREVK